MGRKASPAPHGTDKVERVQRKALGTPGSEEGLKKLDVQVFIEEPEAANA